MSIFVLNVVLVFKLVESDFVVLHERFENFTNALDLARHTLAHPDGTFHVLLLIMSFTA